MTYFSARTTGLLLTCASALAWLLGLVVWQPLTEPAVASPDYAAENNTYWARDLRWSLIAAAVIGLVWAWRGDRARSTYAAIGGVIWLFVDALLDRLDVGRAFGWSAAAVIVAVTSLAIGISRVTDRSGPDHADAQKPTDIAPSRRGSLVVAAYVGASLVPIAASMESPSDTELWLAIGSGLTAGLLIAVAFGAAMSAGPEIDRGRVVAVLILSTASVALVTWGRILEPHESVPAWLVLALAVVMLAGVYGLSREWPAVHGIRHMAMVTLVLAIVYPIVSIAVFILTDFTAPIADAFTALAGSPAVNSSDTDVISSILGIVTGVIVGGAVVLFDRHQWRPNAPAAWSRADAG